MTLDAASPAAARTSPLAIAALVLAFVLPLAAVVVGHVALHQLRRSGEAGHGLALAGTVLGYVLTALGATGVAVYLSLVLAQLGL